LGQRRLRRLQQARDFKVGIAVAIGAAGIAAYVTVTAVAMLTLHNDEAAATPGVRTDRAQKVAARLPVFTLKKPMPTKRPRSAFPNAPSNSGDGRRVVYCNSCQRVWLVEEDDYVFWSYPVSGRRSYPRPGTYKVIRKVHPGMSHELRLPYFVGFTYGTTTDVGFHGIPVRPNGSQIQSDSQLGTYRSAGCVRQSQPAARLLWDFAPMGTTVVVLP
jgi:lipoprotein-anchoring transpeptidase ErfK/SrfK